MLSLQALDDAHDAAEDRARFGRSIPERLGVGSEVLEWLSVRWALAAADSFAQGRFTRLERWCRQRADQLAEQMPPSRRSLARFGLWMLETASAVDPSVVSVVQSGNGMRFPAG